MRNRAFLIVIVVVLTMMIGIVGSLSDSWAWSSSGGAAVEAEAAAGVEQEVAEVAVVVGQEAAEVEVVLEAAEAAWSPCSPFSNTWGCARLESCWPPGS